VVTATEAQHPAAVIEKLLVDPASHTIFPPLAMRVLTMASDPKASGKDLKEVIEVDPGLATRILKMANSAYYGIRQPVRSVERAVVMLGFGKVKAMVIGFVLSSTGKTEGLTFPEYGNFWRYAGAVACSARSVADRFAPNQREDAYLLGLIHEMGVLLMRDSLGKVYDDVLAEAVSQQRCLYEVEKQRLGITHAAAAKVVFEKWGFPPAQYAPIAHHHSDRISKVFGREENLMFRILRVAVYLGLLFENDQQRALYANKAFETARAEFRTELEDMRAIISNTAVEYRKLVQFLTGLEASADEFDAAAEKARQVLAAA